MSAFVTVVDQNGFAPAARRLGISPSAVTRLVAGLEEQLGIALLRRTTRSMTLTDAGTRYLERARRILSEVREAEGSAQAERHVPSGRLLVTAPATFRRVQSGPLMAAYLKRHSEVSGELMLSDRIVNLVEEGIDLALRIGHLDNSSLIARRAGATRRVVVASPAYLARRGTPRHPLELRAHDTITFAGPATPGMALPGRRRSAACHRAVTLHHQQCRQRGLVRSRRRRACDGAGLSGSRCNHGPSPAPRVLVGRGLRLDVVLQLARQLARGARTVAQDDDRPHDRRLRSPSGAPTTAASAYRRARGEHRSRPRPGRRREPEEMIKVVGAGDEVRGSPGSSRSTPMALVRETALGPAGGGSSQVAEEEGRDRGRVGDHSSPGRSTSSRMPGSGNAHRSRRGPRSERGMPVEPAGLLVRP